MVVCFWVPLGRKMVFGLRFGCFVGCIFASKAYFSRDFLFLFAVRCCFILDSATFGFWFVARGYPLFLVRALIWGGEFVILRFFCCAIYI